MLVSSLATVDLTDQTVDAVAVTGDFATGVAAASVTECSYCTTR